MIGYKIFILVFLLKAVAPECQNDFNVCSNIGNIARTCFSSIKDTLLGPPGPQGPAGPQGQKGDTGTAGPPGREGVVDCSKIDTWKKTLEGRINVLEEVILVELFHWHRAKNGFLYKVFTENANYTDAGDDCEKYGAKLAAVGVRDPTVEPELRKLAKASGNHVYIGLDDIENEGQFVWSDGKVSTHSEVPWNTWQPDDYRGRQDCASYNFDMNWALDDLNCSGEHFYLCERKTNQ